MVVHQTKVASKRILPVLTLLALLCGGGCVSSGLDRVSNQARILEVPGTPQPSETYACGPVAVESLCAYWRVPFPEATRADIARTAERDHGLSGAQMRAALEGLGFETFLFEGRLDHGATGLFHQIDTARPALLMLSPRPEHGHYVLCIGYDEPERNVCLLDPVHGRILVHYATFEKAWSAREHFTLLAVPRDPKCQTERKAEAP